MTYCSHCGTQNRDGSMFCNSCGMRLSSSDAVTYEDRRICPACGKENEAERIYCAQCGERIAPPGAEDARPKKPAGSTSDSSSMYLPEWLRRLRAAVGVDQPAESPQPEIELP